MTKDEAIDRFVRRMKLALDMGIQYFFEHPMFIKNVEAFKKSCDSLFAFSNPIKIGITSRSLYIADKHLEVGKQYVDLAHAFHIKKIKSIELRQGVSVEELQMVLSHISQPLVDIIQKGGLAYLNNNNNITHISIGELDYSELLYGEGDEIGDDVWSYLLCEAVEKGGIQEIGEYFRETLERRTVKRLLENKDARQNIQKFFSTLRSKDENSYRYCAKNLLKATIKGNRNLSKDQIYQLHLLVKDLKSIDFADSLWEEIITDENFDAFSFNIFSNLTEESKNNDISKSLEEKIKQNKEKLAVPQIRKKIKEIFSDSSDVEVPETYRYLLSSALEAIQEREEITYDRNHINKNYFYILLDLVSFETKRNRLLSVIKEILNSWNKIIEGNDIYFLKKLQEAIARRRDEDIIIKEGLRDISQKITHHIECLVLDKKISIRDMNFFLPYLEKSSFKITTYFDTVFKENRVNASTLSLIFKLFPYDIEIFYLQLKKRLHDIQFIRLIIESLGEINSSLSVEILQEIFSYSNSVIRQKILQTLQKLSYQNSAFLLPLIRTAPYNIRKEAFRIAIKDSTIKGKAFEEIFSTPFFFGINSRIIKENIQMLKELKAYEARPYLQKLSGKKLFWYKNIKQQAQHLLKQWSHERN